MNLNAQTKPLNDRGHLFNNDTSLIMTLLAVSMTGVNDYTCT